MSHHDKALLFPTARVATTTPAVRRINVAVNTAMMAAIDRVIVNESVSLTEAVRRLVGYGNLVYEAAKERGVTLIVRDSRGGEREIIVL